MLIISQLRGVVRPDAKRNGRNVNIFIKRTSQIKQSDWSIHFLRTFLITDLKTSLLALKVAQFIMSNLGKYLDIHALMPKELHTEYVLTFDVYVWTDA